MLEKEFKGKPAKPISNIVTNSQYQDPRQMYYLFSQYDPYGNGYIAINDAYAYLPQLGLSQQALMYAQYLIPHINRYGNGTMDFQGLMGLVYYLNQLPYQNVTYVG
ncbi:unnamed protein product [Rotaria sp. Silwood1]|nr:unnamed protein product [Rotaria sp. Silwood1]